ncbi:MAG: hypothetical protein R3A48_13700 [Polyangiales bacterium]
MAGARRVVGGAREDGVRESLRARLEAGRVKGAFVYAARAALATPWCWPRDPRLAETARGLCSDGAREVAPGEVLLVSISAGAPREALWSLGWRASDGGVPFGADARACVRLAASVAAREVPHLHTLAELEKRPGSAAPVFKRGDGADHVLVDRSYGLAMTLAAASTLMERPVPARVAALAALREDGSTEPVQGLDRKLSLLADAALGVELVLVETSQRDEAERRCADLGAPLAVLGVAHARDALAAVFPDAAEGPPAAWTPASAPRRAMELFALCAGGGEVARWSSVALAARWIAGSLDASTHHGSRARLARLIAERHANGREFSIPWDEFVRGAHERERAAHAVQAAADAGLDELDDYLRRARAMLSDDPYDVDSLKLQGAIGRALAMQRRYPEALTLLEEASGHWAEGRTPAEGSYALSAWLRVAAILGDDDAWRRACGAADAFARHGAPTSLAFVRFAQGRGHATRGEHDLALRALDAALETSSPPWLARSVRRWRATSFHALGRAQDAAAERDRLHGAREEDGAPCVEGRFAALDEALERGDDPGALVEELRARSPQGVRWLLGASDDARERARILARENPY